MKIVVCDHIHDKGLQILQAAKDVEVVNYADLPKADLLTKIADADVAITRSSTDCDEAFLEAASSLKAIVRAGVGVDNVNIPACSRKGVIVMNVPTANTIAAVELTMAHMLSCMRSFPYAHSQLKDKRVWKREDWYGRELFGKKLGIIGFGNIGSRVGIRCKAFGMDVIAYDPYIKPSKATDVGVTYTKNFDDILDCDIITIHTPKNAETTNMISANEIAKMKDGVVLINCARGGLYNEQDLYDGLKSKKISFAGIDVFSKEPAINHPLLDLDNICVTAHLGANTKESQEKIAIEAAEQALNAVRDISFPNALNLPVKMAETPELVTAFLELAQKIGYLASQINKGALESIKVCASGEIAKYLESLSVFVSVGFAKHSFGDSVNFVNAPFLLKEKGVNLETVELCSNNTGFKNMISIKITTDAGVTTLSGAMFDEQTGRIVEIDGFEVDIEIKGKLVIFKNSDVPGVIGKVGAIFGSHNINIADFRLGRNTEKAQAMAVIIIDEDATPEVLKELAALPEARQVTYANI